MTKTQEAPTQDTEVKATTDVALAKIEQDARMARFESALDSEAGFAHWWRIAKMFADSSFVPQHFRGKPGDCMIAIEMARIMGEHPLALMQQSYMVKGRPGWSSQFYIARANNKAGFQSRIRWATEALQPPEIQVTTGVSRTAGSKNEETFKVPNVKVTAFCLDEHGDRIEATVDTAMAKGEDWLSNPKYQTMFQHMMEWRAATFLVRKYAPEVMFGAHTREELEDIAAAGREIIDVESHPVLTPEDVLPKPKAVEKPPEPVPEPAPEILEAEAKLKEKREQLGIPQPGEVMMTEADGKEILAAAKAGGITPIACWKLIHEDHAKADEWNDLPAQYKTVILAKIAEMGGTT